MTQADNLLNRVVASMASASATPSGRAQKSILSQAATSFARRPAGAEQTVPTGFDPVAATLFEAVVEAAFLVATADGDFDELERNTFETVVHEACHNAIQKSEVHALVEDLMEQLQDDGLDKRIARVVLIVHNDEHRLEVLRIAALMAHASGGVQVSERSVMDALCRGFELPAVTVEQVLAQAAAALGRA